MSRLLLTLEQCDYTGMIHGMSVEEVKAWEWTCDRCNRKKIIPRDDKNPPDHWIKEGLLTFCSFSHYQDFLKMAEDAAEK